MNRLLKFLAASLMLATILAGCAGIVESPEQREAREQREAAAAAEPNANIWPRTWRCPARNWP